MQRGKSTKAEHPEAAFPAFLLYLKICDRIADGLKSLRAIAHSLHRPSGKQYTVSEVSKCLKDLENLYGGTQLVRRQERAGVSGLTDAGRIVRDHARKLEDVARALQEPLSGRAELVISTLNSVLLHVVPHAVRAFELQRRQANLPAVRLRFREQVPADIAWEVERREATFGIGSHLAPNNVPPGVVIQPFGPAIDWVLACPPDHRFVTERRNAIRHLDELASETLIVLPANPRVRQHLPPGERIEVTWFNSCLALVRMGLGVSIVPGFYWVLDKLVQEAAIAYLPIEDERIINSRRSLALYHREDTQLPDEALQVVRLVEQVLTSFLDMRLQSPIDTTTIPSHVQGHWNAYYLSRERTDRCTDNYAGARWWKGNVELVQRGCRVTGIHRDLGNDTAPSTEFRLTGRLQVDLLTVLGEQKKAGAIQRYVATFNVMADKCLIGTSVGWDGSRRPTSAPFILSPVGKELSAIDLNRLSHCTGLQFVPGTVASATFYDPTNSAGE